MTRHELEQERLNLRALARRLLEAREHAIAAGDRQLAGDLYDAHTVALERSEAPDEVLLAGEPLEVRA